MVSLAACANDEQIPSDTVAEAHADLQTAADDLRAWMADPTEDAAEQVADHAARLQSHIAELRDAGADADEAPAQALEAAASDLELFAGGLEDAAASDRDDLDGAWLADINEQWRDAERSLRDLAQGDDEA